MAADPKQTGQAQFSQMTIKEIDFVTRFQKNWEALIEILGIMRPIRKEPGTKLASSVASIELESGVVAEGDEVPLSQATVVPVYYEDLELLKYRKRVTAEAVAKYGAALAVQKTDDALINELTGNIMNSFYTFLQTGTLTGAYSGFQMSVAMAIGKVVDKFKKAHLDYTRVAVFVNTLDVYSYLGAASITLQTAYGLQYVENFLGADIVIVSSEIPQGKVIATPVDNIVLYYIDPADGNFKELGLDYTTSNGPTNLIGVHKEGVYGRVSGDTHALMGMKLWAEYLDGIAVIDIDDSFLTDLTVAADPAGTTYPWTDKTPADFQSNVAVANGEITGTLKFIEGGLSPSGPLSGDGHFIALKFDNFASGLTYANVQVGIVPSQGTGMVTLDSDKDAVFKVADTSQKIKTVQTDASGHKNVQYFGLSGLELEETGA